MNYDDDNTELQEAISRNLPVGPGSLFVAVGGPHSGQIGIPRHLLGEYTLCYLPRQLIPGFYPYWLHNSLLGNNEATTLALLSVDAPRTIT